jgi:NADPH:quinone reductase-like Zn-dependent oxidoreductase
MTTMRAAVHDRYGGPSVVRVDDVERPTVSTDQILVRIRVTTVNRTDCAYRSATPAIVRFLTGLRVPRRRVLGTEYAGEVVEVGSEVTKFSPGDRVFGYNEGHFGTHAEYLTVPETAAVARISDGVSDKSAAASTEGSHYALVTLRKAGIGPGKKVLIYGASGGIGSAAVQLSKDLGATVTAVCGTAHLDTVAGLGADRVVDYQTADFTADQDRYDLVYDAVGKTSFAVCRRLLGRGGMYASSEAGRLAVNFWLVPVTRFARSGRVIFAYPSFDQELITHLGGLVGSGAFTPLLDRSWPLEEIVAAHEYVETGQKVGNVTITVEAA